MRKALVPLVLLLAFVLLPGSTLADSTEPDTTGAVELEVESQTLPLKWKIYQERADRPGTAPIVVNGSIYYVTSSGSLRSLDALTGQTKWEYHPKFDQYSGRNATRPIVAGNLVLYSVSNLVKIGHHLEHDTVATYMIAIDAATGEEEWRFKAVEEVLTAPTVVDNTVYFGSSYATRRVPTNVYFGQVYALAVTTGELKWRFPLIDGNASGDIVASDNTLYVVAEIAEYTRNEHYLYAIDTDTHQTTWRLNIHSDLHHYEVRDPILDGRTIYIVGPNYGSGTLYAVDTRNGKINWQYRVATANRMEHIDGLSSINASRVFTSPPLLPQPGITTLPALGDKTVYFGINIDTGQSHPGGRAFGNIIEHYLVALESNTGQERWRLRSENELRGRPLVAQNSLYLRGLGSDIVAVDPNTGRIRWKYETEAPVTGQFAADRDTLYFADDDGYFYALTIMLPGMPTTGHQQEQHITWITILALLSLTFGLALTKMSKAHARTEDY